MGERVLANRCGGHLRYRLDLVRYKKEEAPSNQYYKNQFRENGERS